ncbi:ethylmalonyl-CoA decarboxylase isoform X1 [Hyla sarda]|uniref:ethylmalonyl-CoA decarboxylase isoform X1 n=1 Tax=Hyla sarda TaxID=327740 RepID=UPI0024C2FEFE|nr:ethylmalonyl-CoA decarboxylase isoform X1 [Hyla sarda]XP_056422472.1 ethylmalonyl-CoA decarboxylase isoform X1 [Hyla sarda]XP_056422473.1 ethylmalonyl-CoA decarboxylase isoform X1 [Hyla sarda]
MSSCLVKGCKTSWRRRESSVSLHTFPKDVNRIRLWLQQIGQFTDNLEEMVLKVWMGTVNDIYRLCSLHFTHDCYNYWDNRRTLRKDAIPSLFGIHEPPSVGNIDQIENSSMSYTDSSNLTLAESEAVSASTTSVATYTNASTTTTFLLTCSANHIKSTSDSCFKFSPNVPLCADAYGTPRPVFFDTLTNSPMLDRNTDFSIMCKPVVQHSSQNCFACGQKIFLENSTNQQKTQQIPQPDSLPNTDKHTITTRDFATNTVFLNNPKSKKIQVRVPTKNKKISCCILSYPKPQAHHSMVIMSKNSKPSGQNNRLGVMQRVGSNLSRRWLKSYSSWKAVCKRRRNTRRLCQTADQLNFKRIDSSQLARKDTSPNQELSAEYDPCSMAQKQPVSWDNMHIVTFQDAYENFLLKKHSTFGPSTSATTPPNECPRDHSFELS